MRAVATVDPFSINTKEKKDNPSSFQATYTLYKTKLSITGPISITNTSDTTNTTNSPKLSKHFSKLISLSKGVMMVHCPLTGSMVWFQTCWPAGDLLCGLWMWCLCLCKFPLGIPASSHSPVQLIGDSRFAMSVIDCVSVLAF